MATKVFIPEFKHKEIFLEFNGIEEERYGDNYIFRIRDYEFTTELEPKYMSRFVLEFPGRFNIKSYLVNNVSEINFSNGKWCDVTIEFLDTISNPSNEGLVNIINEFGSHQNDGRVLFPIILTIIDPVGATIQTYRFNVKDFEIILSDFSYDSKELMVHKFIIKSYDFSIL